MLHMYYYYFFIDIKHKISEKYLHVVEQINSQQKSDWTTSEIIFRGESDETKILILLRVLWGPVLYEAIQ